MTSFLDALRGRALPAILTALGAALVTAGLVSLVTSGPADAGPGGSAGPSAVAVSAPPTASPSSASSPPSAPPTEPVPASRVATRVRVAALGIDLPVIAQPTPDSVPCGVAMYLGEMRQPGAARATYLYAHAQRGMFLSILEASRLNNGAAMLGMIIEVYTSDDMLFLYELTEVRRHVPYDTGLDDPLDAVTDQVWLQTSEGIGATFPKLQVVGEPLSSSPADPDEAHPSARPVACG